MSEEEVIEALGEARGSLACAMSSVDDELASARAAAAFHPAAIRTALFHAEDAVRRLRVLEKAVP